MRYEHHDLDGNGSRRTQVYDMPVVDANEYWPSVTDVPCPCCDAGTIRWAEAGYAPGYRICDGCGRHFSAGGNMELPVLLRVRDRRSKV